MQGSNKKKTDIDTWKYKFRRKIALCLGGVAMAAGVTGCGGASGDEVVTLTVFNMDSDFTGEEEGWFADVMEEKFGVKLEFVTATADTLATREETGFIGDIILFNTLSDYETAAKAELLFDWQEDGFLDNHGATICTEYADVMRGADAETTASLESGVDAETTASLESGVDAETTASSESEADAETTASLEPEADAETMARPESGADAIYGIACGLSEVDNTDCASTQLRYDLYRQLGGPQLRNMEDLTQVLLAMKETAPLSDEGKEVFAISATSDQDTEMIGFVADLAELYGWEQAGFGFYQIQTGEFVSCLDPEGIYVNLLREMNEWYLNGLLDPASMTQTEENVSDKMEQGQILFGMSSWGTAGYNTQEHLAGGQTMETIGLEDYQVISYRSGEKGDSRTYAIGAAAAYPELCMDIIDWIYSEEGCYTLAYGADYQEGIFSEGTTHLPIPVYRRTLNTAENTAEAAENDEETQSSYEYYSSKGLTLQAVDYFTMERPTETEQLIAWNAVAGEICVGSWNAIYAGTEEEFNAIIDKMNTECSGYGIDNLLVYCEEEIRSVR